MFSVRGDEWEDIDTDSPKRTITDIASVVELSAVTFPAYSATQIYARSKEALESAKATLEKAREQRTKPVETGINELELLKEKTKILGGSK